MVILYVIMIMIIGYYFIDFLVNCFKKDYYQFYKNGPTLLTYHSLSTMRMTAEAAKLEEYRLLYDCSVNEDGRKYIRYDDNTEDQIDALIMLTDFSIYGYRFNSEIGQLIPLEINFEKRCLDVVQREDVILYLDNGYRDYNSDDRLQKCVMRYNRDLEIYFSNLRNTGLEDETKKARYSIIGYILINNV